MHFGQRWIFYSSCLKGEAFPVDFFVMFGKSTNSTHGKRASFSQNSQKWHPFSENDRFLWKFSEFFGKSINSTLGKRASFSQNSQKWHPLSEIVRLFRRIHIFFFAEIAWFSLKKHNDVSTKNNGFSWNDSRLFEFRRSAYCLRLS